MMQDGRGKRHQRGKILCFISEAANEEKDKRGVKEVWCRSVKFIE